MNDEPVNIRKFPKLLYMPMFIMSVFVLVGGAFVLSAKQNPDGVSRKGSVFIGTIVTACGAVGVIASTAMGFYDMTTDHESKTVQRMRNVIGNVGGMN